MTIRDALKNPFVLLIASALPILLFRHPPIMDAPNHLARIWLEAHTPLTGVLSKAYVIDWSRASSNILVDLVVAPVMRLIGLDATWVVVTLLMVLAPSLAAILISRHLNGRSNRWQALALSTAWGQSTISGFVAYSLSIALALTFCLLDLKLTRVLGAKIRCLLKSAAILAIYLTHPFGVGLFFAFEFAMLLGSGLAEIRALTLRRVLTAFAGYALMIIPTIAYIATNRGNSPLEINPVDYRGFVSHIVSLISPFFAYDGAVELPLFAVIAGSVAIAAVRGRITFHAGLGVSVIVLGVLALLIPDGIGNASLLTRRLPLMAALLACIAVHDRRNPPADGQDYFALACCLAILAHTAWIFHVWRIREHDYADLQQASTLIPAGSKVLIALEDGHPDRWSEPGQYVHGFFIRGHLPSLIVPLSRSYVPVLFAIPGQQPLDFSDGFRALQAQIANIPRGRDLLTRTPPFPADHYLETWECDFDYLLMLKQTATSEQTGYLPHIRLLSSANFVDLMKIERPANCRPPLPQRNIR